MEKRGGVTHGLEYEGLGQYEFTPVNLARRWCSACHAFLGTFPTIGLRSH